MPFEAEWLIGFIPFGFVGVLLWLRLKAGGATNQEALKRAGVFAAGVFITLLGIGIAAKGWHRENQVSLAIGALLAIGGFWFLRRSLARFWQEFPL